MKLKYERFESLSYFSIRGMIDPSQHKLLDLGLITLCKDLAEPLIINLSLAEFNEVTAKHLIELKKTIAKLTTQKMAWITPQKGLGDFPNVMVYVSRLNGFKPRQVGERIQLEDEIYKLQQRTQIVEKIILEKGGDQDRAQQIILENRILKEQERILKESLHWQDARMKLQAKIPSTNSELSAKTLAAIEEFKKGSGMEIDL